MRLEWIYLALAIVTEVIASSSLKLTEGFTKIVPSIVVVVFYVLSFLFLSQALRRIDLGIAYAIWSGVGIAVIATIGVVLFREEVTTLKVVSFLLIIAGSVGLSLAGAEG